MNFPILYDRRVRYYRKAVGKDSHVELTDFRQARAKYHQSVSKSQNPETIFSNLLTFGNFDQAEIFIETQVSGLESLRYRANLADARSDYDSADELFHDGIRIGDDKAILDFAVSLVNRDADFNKTQNALNRALDAGIVKVYWALAQFWWLRGEDEIAERVALEGFAAGIDGCVLVLGYIAFSQSKYEEALSLALDAWSLGVEGVEFLAYLALGHVCGPEVASLELRNSQVDVLPASVTEEILAELFKIDARG